MSSAFLPPSLRLTSFAVSHSPDVSPGVGSPSFHLSLHFFSSVTSPVENCSSSGVSPHRPPPFGLCVQANPCALKFPVFSSLPASAARLLLRLYFFILKSIRPSSSVRSIPPTRHAGSLCIFHVGPPLWEGRALIANLVGQILVPVESLFLSGTRTSPRVSHDVASFVYFFQLMLTIHPLVLRPSSDRCVAAGFVFFSQFE